MRKRNADKTKQFRGGVTAEAIMQFRYGNKYDPAALEAVRAMRRALCPAISFPPCPAFDKQLFDEHRETFWQFIATNYNRRKPDGSFFRKLADAMEVDEIINDPVWHCGIGEIMFRKECGQPMFTVSELHDNLRRREIITNRKTIERMFAWLKVEPAPAKRGPRLGTKQKSVHRTRR